MNTPTYPLSRCWLVGALAAFGFVTLASATAPSVTVFSSFGAGNTYNSGIVWGVSGASTSGGYRGQAEFFTPSSAGDLTSITLATYHQSGSGRSNFYLAQDNGSGTGPGTVLESFLNTANNNGLLTLTSAVKPLLQTGETYWLCDEPADATTVNGWYESSSYAPGFAYERSEWSWNFMPPPSVPCSGVFSVSVVPVPEPGVISLGALGLLLVGRKVWKGAI